MGNTKEDFLGPCVCVYILVCECEWNRGMRKLSGYVNVCWVTVCAKICRCVKECVNV